MIQDRQKLYNNLIGAYTKSFKCEPPIEENGSLESIISLLTRAVFTGIPLRPNPKQDVVRRSE